MRIAYFSDNLYPELSGIADTIITTGKELAKRGHQIAYIGPYYAHRDYAIGKRQYPLDKKDDTIDGLPIKRLFSLPMPISPTGQSRIAIPTGESFSFLDSFKPDVIHTQSPYGTGWEAVRAARRYKVPLIGTNHTAIEDFFPPGTREVMRRWDAWYYNHCAYVTAPYQALLDQMETRGFRRPGRVVANPAELSAFTPPTAAERLEYKRNMGLTGPVVLYTGRLGIEKRVDVIVRAVALLKKDFPTITLIATGHGAAEKSLKALAQKLGVGKQITFIGFLSRATLPHAYKAADVFAMMSTSDSQSIALMQAYSSGLPAVCARARGLPDYTPEDAGFLVEAGDHKALAGKIKLLLDDSALRDRMGAAAIDFSKKFSPEHIAEEWKEIYSDCISRAASASA